MSTGNLRQAGKVNSTSVKKARYPPDKCSHFSLQRNMTTSFNQGSKKENVNFLDGQAHFEAHLPIGWRVKAASCLRWSCSEIIHWEIQGMSSYKMIPWGSLFQHFFPSFSWLKPSFELNFWLFPLFFFVLFPSFISDSRKLIKFTKCIKYEN